MANWAELPPELIGLVLKRLIAHDVYDYLSFRAVCHPWRSVASEKHNYAGVSVCKIPWLMMAEKENSDVRSFYSLSNNKFYNIHLPEAGEGGVGGLRMIRLPSQTTFGDQYPEKSSFTSKVVREIFIRKAIRLSTPTSTTNGNCIIIAIYSQWGNGRNWMVRVNMLFFWVLIVRSLSVAEYPELKGNCVYFTDDDVNSWDCEAGRYTGIYSFENQTDEFIDLGLDMHSTFSPPLWITPNLC
ncbi:hypothetical protein GIB67_025940 [Kingdonia uniflora]|uniref:F-box domain-containing protein n=1 Tax=Kingdonia uniflora TaxID=39325 RepID=A0A7J7NW87_9MAGN|nr:hypothetical protein GIB67_025940 [Kingdonia uniflora]